MGKTVVKYIHVAHLVCYSDCMKEVTKGSAYNLDGENKCKPLRWLPGTV
jgi:hypothetical protein